ncbi:hypothetical protein [Chondromyces crocatus]|uniref:Uncharacterized protein n=1 Tax=Chondromyces crocatus TaxID=52 RepID=A0A0K1EAZ7_CHOCO|nr:hypothetical protein [Chondromyces crocatus]AKT37743.1 uncharacterized protein CMC5_018850 [Chondromyces crocatus]
MKDVLDRYIRSLAEQELAKDAPERLQDLGTFVVWLLERRGFTVHLRSFKHEGTERRKSSGLTQHGVDIIASRHLKSGRRCLYLFVLKQGNITIEAAGESRNSIFHDIELASLRPFSSDGLFDLGGGSFECRKVVAVHNGDLDERIVGIVADKRAYLRKHRQVGLWWWDASTLVDYALRAPRDGSGSSLRKAADPSLFPPGIRPFARAALDSLVLNDGRRFDLRAVDRLLDEVLPVGRRARDEESGNRLEPGEPAEARALRRRLAELSLFARMVEVECRRLAGGDALPTFDTIERVLCRGMEHLRRIPSDRFAGHRGAIRASIRGLLDQYIAKGWQLHERLTPLLHAEYGLALGSPSERLDYPLRVLRLSGYLAVAALALLDRKESQGARQLAEALASLWKTNEAACLGPITDDQIIEISLVFDLWRRCGMSDLAAKVAESLALRWHLMVGLGFPLPAIRQSARVPPDEEDLRVLAEAHLRGRAGAPPSFDDSASTILPLALYLAYRGGCSFDHPAFDQVAPPGVPPRGASSASTENGDRNAGERASPYSSSTHTVYLQAWQPPEDAADEWYVREIEHRGLVKVFDKVKAFDKGRGLENLALAFEAFNQPLPQSPAEAWGFRAIDCMAWKCWRTPPPMAIFCEPRSSSST